MDLQLLHGWWCSANYVHINDYHVIGTQKHKITSTYSGKALIVFYPLTLFKNFKYLFNADCRLIKINCTKT